MRTDRLVFFSVTALGISSIITQLILIREFMNVFFGNELVFGIILANWLFLNGLGSYIGRYTKGLKDKLMLLICSQITIAFLPFISITLVRMLKSLILIPGEMANIFTIIISSFFILFPYCVISGALLVVACSVLTIGKREGRIGKVYVMDNIGDILGGLLFSFILVFLFNPFEIALFTLIINLIPAALLLRIKGKVYLSIFTTILMLISIIFFISFDINMKTIKMMFYGQEIVYNGYSPYGNIVVTKTGNQLNFFENGLPLFSTQNIIANEETVHYAMIQHPNPKNVLLISGGISGTLNEILKYHPEILDYVELDPLILDVGRRFTKYLDRRVNVIIQDGRMFVKNTKNKYDVVIIDLPDPSNAQINRFYTIEFFCELKRILNPEGVISLSLSSNENYMNVEIKNLNAIVYNSLKICFKNVIVIPGDKNFFVASDSELTYSIPEKIRKRGIETVYVNENYLFGKLTEDRIKYVMESVKDKKAGVNRDFTPLAYYYHMMYWLSLFGDINLLLIFIPILLIILLALKIGPIPFAISSTGFSAAGIEIILVIGFQILYGYAYHYLGVIITMFMIGLAIGAFHMNKKLKKMRKIDMVKIEMLISLYSIILPLVLLFLSRLSGYSVISSLIVFPVLTLAIAIFVGMEFPIASKLHFKRIEYTAGVLYSADMIGACIGAFVISVILVPILGILNVCIILGILNVFSGFRVWKGY